MSDTEESTTEDAPANLSGDAGLEQLMDEAASEEREREERLTEAEKQKRKIMRERGEVDPDAAPIHLTHDGYDFEFSPFPKKVRVWVENTSFEFLGIDEETLADDPDRGEEMRSVKDQTAMLLEQSSKAAAYDADFWSEWFGVEERMSLIKDILDRQDEREGNRR